MQRKTVLLLFGGESSEHEVSVSSARNVFAALDDAKFDIILGFIDKRGKWWLLDSLEQLADMRNAPQLIPVLGTRSFTTQPFESTVTLDVIFAVLHGENGEDGTVQGLARLLHIPVVGSGLEASVIAIDKDLTKRLLAQAGVPVIPCEVHIKGQPLPSFAALTEKLGNPLFVKPAHLGSSVGIAKVHDEAGFMVAIEAALELDNKVLIERAIIGRELEIAVLGNIPTFRVSGVGEIQSGDEFYTYAAKYSSDSQAKVIVPADVPADVVARMTELAQLSFVAIEGKGLARIDFFYVEESDELFVLEVNTLPGFTNISMYPKLWREAGIGYSELVEKLIEFALIEEDTK